MLKVLVLLLVVANGLFFAWTEGAMPGLGPSPSESGRDLQRWTQQLRPEAVQLLGGGGDAGTAGADASASVASAAAVPVVPVPVVAAAASATAAVAASACLEAGPFGVNEIAAVEKTVAGITKPQSWSIKPVHSAGVWLVYTGTFPEVDALDRKKAELRRLTLNFEEVRSPGDLVPGLSLGRFSDEARAQDRLAELTRRGLTGARVVSASGPRTMYTLRLPQADASLQAAALRLNGDPLQGKSFVPCAQQH